MTDELQRIMNVEDILSLVKIETPAAFPMEDYLKTPFTHHTVLLRNSKNNEDRDYYMRRCVEEHMSVSRLEQVITDGERGKTGKPHNNFIERIDDKSMARKGVMQFKDSYLLDFINTEEIGERDLQDIDEQVVEQQIIHNVKKFIMTFGKDFAFVGNQYPPYPLDDLSLVVATLPDKHYNPITDPTHLQDTIYRLINSQPPHTQHSASKFSS